mmetsp:Transcript_4232/g.8239  ORF Transcript_4232/g.8239 Transcript_4232/m.8239 type:complete len:197 (-) Transcript_4232:1741-2331(-)
MAGLRSEGESSWVRLIHIPEEWVEGGAALFETRTYRSLFTDLLSAGCIPLGLYRSGQAPVRMLMDATDLSPEEEERYRRRERREVSTIRTEHVRQLSASLPKADARRARNLSSASFQLDGEVREKLRSEGDLTENVYVCISTRRRVTFEEVFNGENMLPYVYTCPEPFTAVSETDGVFVLCPPDYKLPDPWDRNRR